MGMDRVPIEDGPSQWPARVGQPAVTLLGALLCLLAAPWGAHAQSHAEAELAESLRTHQLRSMTALTDFGALSVGAGAMLMGAGGGARDAMFWGGLQHLLWGATNVAIGARALSRAAAGGEQEPSWQERAARTRRVFWINAALDVLYVSSGALMWGLGSRGGVRGSGAAIVSQGGFLLAFDLTAALRVPGFRRRGR